MNTDNAANDLTQLSSREQLSALMDGALPADQTRFLLRRLQHDASLAESWDRWRVAGEVMRGLAPAHRLPADFASRVSAALHGDEAMTAPAMREAGGKRSPAWLRWGGGAAMAASLAVAALVVRQPAVDDAAASQQVAASAPAVIDGVASIPSTPSPEMPQAPTPVDAGQATQALAAAGAVVAAQRPERTRRERAMTSPRAPAIVRESAAQADAAVAATPLPAIPQPDIATRPWPRAILPQYSQQGGLTVGFGEHARGAVPYNPFQAREEFRDLPPPGDTASETAASTPPQAPADQP